MIIALTAYSFSQRLYCLWIDSYNEKIKRLATIFLTLICASCVTPSQPNNFYILQPLAKINDAITSHSQSTLALGIGRVEIADYLNQPQLLKNKDNFELQRSKQARWAEPLKSNIQRVLLENLTRLTGNHQLQASPFRADSRPQWVMNAKVLALDINENSEAQLRVDWYWVERTSGRRLTAPIGHYFQAAEVGPRGQAKAFSQLLLDWSEAITAQLSELE